MSAEFFVDGRRCVFLHIPKTGGNWVEAALRSLDLDGFNLMLGLRERHNLFHHQLADAYSFCFVRHPVSWYESCFKFQTAQGWRKASDYNPDGWHPWGGLDECRADDFGDFVANCARLQPGFVTRMYESYTGPDGAERVNAIGRQEHLAADLFEVLTTLGVDVALDDLQSLDPVLVSDSVETSWPADQLAVIRQLESPTIDRYHYG